MIIMGVMQSSVHEVIDVIAVLHGFVSAARPMCMGGPGLGCTAQGISFADLDNVFVDMIPMHVMQMTMPVEFPHGQPTMPRYEVVLESLALYQQALRTAERVKTLRREIDDVSRELHQRLDDLDIIIEEIQGNSRDGWLCGHAITWPSNPTMKSEEADFVLHSYRERAEAPRPATALQPPRPGATAVERLSRKS
jgi:hypothetical protein